MKPSVGPQNKGEKRLMKKVISIFLILTALFSLVLPIFAANGSITYDGAAKKFIFEQGSKYSPTDLFGTFKDVMPGDSITQSITVRNDASNNVKVKIYIRSLGAHEDSEDFLSQLALRVKKSEENEMAYMFDAAASESAQLTDWVLLGTLYSGGEVNLDIILDVPTSLENEYSSQIGYLDWEFKIEELPIEPSDPEAPETGDGIGRIIWFILLIVTFILFFIIIFFKRRRKEDGDEENGKSEA